MAINKFIKRFYPESALLGYTFVDGTMSFYNAVNRMLGKNAMQKTVLDLGCGRGWYMYINQNAELVPVERLRNFKGRVKKVIGIDVDEGAATNPTVDEFHLMHIDKPWPVETASIDLCICDYVMEHVTDVDFFFSELSRVMKKDSAACFRTPNKKGYMAVASSIAPNSLHTRILKRVQPNRKEADVFPVVYNCNTRSKFKHYLKAYGFEPHVFYYEAEPNYLKFSYISFLFGYYFQKFLPQSLKSVIFAFGIKK